MTPGNIDSGKRRILNKTKLTNAVLASSLLFGSIRVYDPIETIDTITGAHTHANVVTIDKYP